MRARVGRVSVHPSLYFRKHYSGASSHAGWTFNPAIIQDTLLGSTHSTSLWIAITPALYYHSKCWSQPLFCIALTSWRALERLQLSLLHRSPLKKMTMDMMCRHIHASSERITVQIAALLTVIAFTSIHCWTTTSTQASFAVLTLF